MLRERATIIVSWEKWPKKEGAYPEREIDTDRLQNSVIEQSLLIDCKRPQKSDIDYKVYW
jgi:hypothetical protein